MADLKARFQGLADNLFDRFSSLAVSVVFAEPDTRDVQTGAVTQAGATTDPILCQRPLLSEVARLELGLSESEFILIAKQKDLAGFTPQANHTIATVDGIRCRLVNLRGDAAGATYRIRIKGG